jgi:hypothetical protein
MPNYFTQKDVIKKLGLKRWQVQYFSDKNIVKPEHGLGGQGNARRYDQRNLVQFALIKALADWGLQAKDVEFVIRYLFEKMVTVKDGKSWKGCRFDEIERKAISGCYLIFYRNETEWLEIEAVIDKPLNQAFDLDKIHGSVSFLAVDLLKIINKAKP